MLELHLEKGDGVSASSGLYLYFSKIRSCVLCVSDQKKAVALRFFFKISSFHSLPGERRSTDGTKNRAIPLHWLAQMPLSEDAPAGCHWDDVFYACIMLLFVCVIVEPNSLPETARWWFCALTISAAPCCCASSCQKKDLLSASCLSVCVHVCTCVCVGDAQDAHKFALELISFSCGMCSWIIYLAGVFFSIFFQSGGQGCFSVGMSRWKTLPATRYTLANTHRDTPARYRGSRCFFFHHLIMPLASSPRPLSSGFWLFTKICCNEEVITVANTTGSVFKGESGVPPGAWKYSAGGRKVFPERDDGRAHKLRHRHHQWDIWRHLKSPFSLVLKRLAEKQEAVIACDQLLKTPRLIGAATPQQALVFFVIQEVIYCYGGKSIFETGPSVILTVF